MPHQLSSGAALSIGDLARQTATKVPTIRYYEEVGLMPRPLRTAGRQRRYDHSHLRRLAFIRHARELGFPLEAVRILLDLSDQPERPCADADRIATRQLAEVRSRIARLTALEAELVRMTDACRHGRMADCRVIEVLGDHGLCTRDHADTGQGFQPG